MSSTSSSFSSVLEDIITRRYHRHDRKIHNHNNDANDDDDNDVSSVQDFFNNVWQKRPMLFRRKQRQQNHPVTETTIPSSSSLRSSCKNDYGRWNEDMMMTTMKEPSQEPQPSSSSSTNSSSLWDEMIYQRWYIVEQLFKSADERLRRHRTIRSRVAAGEGNENNTDDDNDDDDDIVPILFRNQQPLPEDEMMLLMEEDSNDSNAGGAPVYCGYLDGCSIVINHADLQQPHIAALCLDLQKKQQSESQTTSTTSSPSSLSIPSSFPHVYANVYITPPGSQTAPPHADDRDVLIFQLLGSKSWTVYQTVPVPYPYPDQQVGKGGLSVPRSVLDGPIVALDENYSTEKDDTAGGSVRDDSMQSSSSSSSSYSTILREGDVMYLPRGMVHEAATPTNTDSATTNIPSVHITVAIATHDWTLAGNLSRLIQRRLHTTTQVAHRMSLLPVIPPTLSTSLSSSSSSLPTTTTIIQQMIDDALEDVRREITGQVLYEDVMTRIERHNRRSYPLRMKCIHQARMESITGATTASTTNSGNDSTNNLHVSPTTGCQAASRVTFNSWIRSSTPTERDMVTTNQGKKRPRGLQVGERIADDIMSMIGYVKSNPSKTFRVADLRQDHFRHAQMGENEHHTMSLSSNPFVCDLAVLSMVKRAVELGAFAVVD